MQFFAYTARVYTHRDRRSSLGGLGARDVAAALIVIDMCVLPRRSARARRRLNVSADPAGPAFISVEPIPSNVDLELTNILWRFELPRRDGEVVSGTGAMLFGFGRYNCDGTYSYYDARARRRIGWTARRAVRIERAFSHGATVHVDARRTGAERFRVQLPRDPRGSLLQEPVPSRGSSERGEALASAEIVH